MEDHLLEQAYIKHVRYIQGKICEQCSGTGVILYNNGSTWKHKIGKAVMTPAPCEICWGSGSSEFPWLNLKENEKKLKELEKLKKERK